MGGPRVALEGPTGHAAFNGEELFVFLSPFMRDGETVVPPGQPPAAGGWLR
jgi:hypothetical protein